MPLPPSSLLSSVSTFTPPPATPGAPLLDAVARELRAPRWHLGFAAEVEVRYEADQGAARRRGLVLAGLVALFVYDLFLLNDLVVRPAVLHEALLWRLGCLTPYGLAMLALIHRGLPPRWRELAMASTIVVAVFASGMIMWRTTSAAATYDLFVFTLIFTSGNIVFPLRFWHALVSSLLAFGVAAAFGIAHPAIPPDALPFALGLLAGSAVFTVLACYRIERAARQSYLLLLREELRSQAAHREAQAFALLSQTDALTQLANRRAFDALLQQRWSAAADQRQPLALLIIDIDNFKRFNDHFGHPAGDACLQRTAAALRSRVREGDLLARLGGEEFAVLLSRATPEGVLAAAAERLRQGVEAQAIEHDGQDGRRVVTISVGGAQLVPTAGADPAALMVAADAALYEAKRSGRNRCVVAAPGAVAS
jgi:diguanylate cyclase (GGDEF)-like protein